jgi:hypothetical protein
LLSVFIETRPEMKNMESVYSSRNIWKVFYTKTEEKAIWSAYIDLFHGRRRHCVTWENPRNPHWVVGK